MAALDDDLIMDSDCFNESSELRCDFTLSKVYSLFNNQTSVTYDNRVAAALGFFIIEYLKISQLGKLPESLNFTVHKDRNANIAFDVFGIGNGSVKLHGLSTLRLTWIFSELATDPAIIKRLNARYLAEAIILIKAGFYMIGENTGSISSVNLPIADVFWMPACQKPTSRLKAYSTQRCSRLGRHKQGLGNE